MWLFDIFSHFLLSLSFSFTRFNLIGWTRQINLLSLSLSHFYFLFFTSYCSVLLPDKLRYMRYISVCFPLVKPPKRSPSFGGFPSPSLITPLLVSPLKTVSLFLERVAACGSICSRRYLSRQLASCPNMIFPPSLPPSLFLVGLSFILRLAG